jgi:hypothetical protein
LLENLPVWTVETKSLTELPVDFPDQPPTSEKAKQIEALVNKAAALNESEDKAIFPEFRKKDTEWFNGDTYLFVYYLKSNVLLNADLRHFETYLPLVLKPS